MASSNRVTHLFHPRQRCSFLAATAFLCEIKLFLIASEAGDARAAFTFDLRQDLVKARIVWREKERPAEVDTGGLGARAIGGGYASMVTTLAAVSTPLFN